MFLLKSESHNSNKRNSHTLTSGVRNSIIYFWNVEYEEIFTKVLLKVT